MLVDHVLRAVPHRRHADPAPAVQSRDDARRRQHGHVHQHPGAYDANFLTFMNSNLAGLGGPALRVLWTRVTRPFGAELAAARLMRSSWHDVVLSASTPADRRPAQSRRAHARPPDAADPAPRRDRRPPPSVDRELSRSAHRVQRARPARAWRRKRAATCAAVDRSRARRRARVLRTAASRAASAQPVPESLHAVDRRGARARRSAQGLANAARRAPPRNRRRASCATRCTRWSACASRCFRPR